MIRGEPIMCRHFPVLLVSLLSALAGTGASAQDSIPARRAFAVGLNSNAGVVGVEWVARSFSPATRLGGAAGIGIFGAGVRLNMALRAPRANDRVPYLAAGLSYIAWLPPGITPKKIVSIEGGMQLWPTKPRRMYFDVGAGAGLEPGSAGDPVPALRVVAGWIF